ncbi:MAG TPA: 5'-nucleotidase C-terminal domain-containing protein, partial [Sphingomicrobium sp.]|nr:5'-nucleotidase C-terminal domain-containing protein [Sphingomicrobium sp.]
PKMLMPSRGFFFAYDERLAAGQRIVEMRLNGKAIDPGGRYRVAVNHFLAGGGDKFTVLADGTDAVDLGLDLDAMEAWLKKGAPVPKLGRVKNLGPPPAS